MAGCGGFADRRRAITISSSAQAIFTAGQSPWRLLTLRGEVKLITAERDEYGSDKRKIGHIGGIVVSM